MLVEIVIFSIFFCKKAKKARNLRQIFAKTQFFDFEPERWSTVLFQKKIAFFSKKTFLPMKCSVSQLFIGKNIFLKKAHFFGNKTVDQRSGANLKKTCFLQKKLLQISCLF